MVYSQGFNPRARLSLPLPRPVGVESDDDLLCLTVQDRDFAEGGLLGCGKPAAKWLMGRLSGQLPQGCCLFAVSTAKSRKPVQPHSAVYVFSVQQSRFPNVLRERVCSLLDGDHLVLERSLGPLRSGFKRVDVRPFLESIELCDCDIRVKCKVSASGSIRINEILRLLGLETDMLAAPIRRVAVEWQES